MPNLNLTIDQLCSAIEDLNDDEFRLLDQALDRKRQNRLKEIVQRARDNAADVTPENADHIISKAIAEVRAENATHGRT